MNRKGGTMYDMGRTRVTRSEFDDGLMRDNVRIDNKHQRELRVHERAKNVVSRTFEKETQLFKQKQALQKKKLSGLNSQGHKIRSSSMGAPRKSSDVPAILDPGLINNSVSPPVSESRSPESKSPITPLILVGDDSPFFIHPADSANGPQSFPQHLPNEAYHKQEHWSMHPKEVPAKEANHKAESQSLHLPKEPSHKKPEPLSLLPKDVSSHKPELQSLHLSKEASHKPEPRSENRLKQRSSSENSQNPVPRRRLARAALSDSNSPDLVVRSSSRTPNPTRGLYVDGTGRLREETVFDFLSKPKHNYEVQKRRDIRVQLEKEFGGSKPVVKKVVPSSATRKKLDSK